MVYRLSFWFTNGKYDGLFGWVWVYDRVCVCVCVGGWGVGLLPVAPEWQSVCELCENTHSKSFYGLSLKRLKGKTGRRSLPAL